MKNPIIIFAALIIISASCRKPDDNINVTPEQARDTLFNIMNSFYYWYDRMPSVNKENYSNPYDLIEAMRYEELDKWSFVADYEEFADEAEGIFLGHGIRIGLDTAGRARIVQIYRNSPLFTKGVRRGWIIKTVNGHDIAAILLADDMEAYNAAFGPSKEGITNNFVFENPQGTELSFSSTKISFTINSVILFDTVRLDNTGSKVAGHLVFESFIIPSEGELRTAFTYFKSMNVEELILDLRYNSGGFMNIAQQLASYIGGNTLSGEIFARMTYNDKQQSENMDYPFLASVRSLSLSRVIVITTRLTASASEAVINGLDPHISVISIGDTTHGKPVGMNGWQCGMQYYFWPVTFRIVNSAGTGDYFGGIIPDKIATDDVTRDFNDNEEECLREAILYLRTGSFSGKGAGSFSRSKKYPERPSRMNNAYIYENIYILN